MNSIVKEYCIVNPKKVMINYSWFEYCKYTPVAIEHKNQNAGFYPSVDVPSTEFLLYMNQLSVAPDEVAENPRNRKLCIIELKNKGKLYVLPNLKDPNDPSRVFENNVVFDVTPEIELAIKKAFGIHTR